MAGAVEFRLLGPLALVRNGSEVAVGGRRQRTLLALLLLEPGRAVPSDRLVEELWRGAPPPGAATTLRSYVSRLRAVLGSDAPVEAGAAGYTISVPPGAVDAWRFEDLTRRGHAAISAGRVRRARQQLTAALALWRGPALADLAENGRLRLEAERLDELRLLALEGRIEADLSLGRSAELVEELERLVVEHPYRERLCRQLMLALYRAERQADALAAYRRARRILRDDLGLEPSEELQRLEGAILRHQVTPARLPPERHNLPAAITSFIGRSAELTEVERLLDDSRLVTLTGVGGAGKTRLALEAARRAVADTPDGVFFVDLAPLRDGALVAHQTAGALGLREEADSTIDEQLRAELREGDALLVLDNCEHLRVACAELSERLLRACPLLRILATSREALGVLGEVDFPVPPLALPPAAGTEAEIRSSEAVRLLLARARESRPGLDEDRVLGSAARICRDLDGLPLAIELAAARTKALSFEEIEARLSNRFRFLVSWRRLGTARHRTLREAIDWSHELLSEDERVLLSGVSVFAGGFTLAAAAAICREGDDVRAEQLIGKLVDASLLVAEEQDGAMRYRLLETVRQYAAERLEASRAAEAVRSGHAHYFVELAEREAAAGLRGAELAASLVRLEREHDNMRAALAWTRLVGAADEQLRLASAIWRFWWVRGHFSEGRAHLRDALDAGEAIVPGLRASGLYGAAGLAWAQGDLPGATALADEAAPLYAAAGNPLGEALCLSVLGHVALAQEDFSRAEEMFDRSRRVAERLESQRDVAVALHNLGSVAFGRGDLPDALARYRSSRSLYEEQDDPEGVALCDLYLGFGAVEEGRQDDAAELFSSALRSFVHIGFVQYAAQCLEGIAAVAVERGDAVASACLLAAAAALRENTGDAPTVAAELRERAIVMSRAELGEEEFAAAWADGAQLTVSEAALRAERALAG